MSRHATTDRGARRPSGDTVRVSDLLARYGTDPSPAEAITAPLPLVTFDAMSDAAPLVPAESEPSPVEGPIAVAALLARYGQGETAPRSHRAARTSSRPTLHLPPVRLSSRPVLAAAAVLVTAGAAAEAPALFSTASSPATAAGGARPVAQAAAQTSPTASPAGSSTSAAPTSSPTATVQPSDVPSERLRPTRVSRGTKRTVLPSPHLKPGQTVPGIWVRPNDGPYNSCFCMRWGVMHWGVDMAGQLGSPILAVGDGTVLEAGPADGFGNWVVIQHSNGDVSIYGHMQYYFVRPGQKVKAGQKIALVGQEGQATGPHLHFEVHKGGLNGPKIDPVPWLKARGIDLGPYNPNG